MFYSVRLDVYDGKMFLSCDSYKEEDITFQHTCKLGNYHTLSVVPAVYNFFDIPYDMVMINLEGDEINPVATDLYDDEVYGDVIFVKREIVDDDFRFKFLTREEALATVMFAMAGIISEHETSKFSL